MLTYTSYDNEVNKGVRTDRVTKCDDDRLEWLKAVLPPQGIADIVIDYADNNVHVHTTFMHFWTGLSIRYPDRITQQIHWCCLGYNQPNQLICRVHYRAPCSQDCPTYGGLGRIRVYISAFEELRYCNVESLEDAFVTEIRGPFVNKGEKSASFFARPAEASFYVRWQAGSLQDSSSLTWFCVKTMQEEYRITLPNEFAWRFWYLVRNNTFGSHHAKIPKA